MPLISVVIPVYNGEKTIRETVGSVLNQTFSDFELIVVDDGSKDQTLEILSSILDPRLKVLTYPNAGVAATRNRGFSQSSGELISFLDADDLWTPEKLEAQLKALQENPQAAVAYSWTNFFDESGQFLHPGSHCTYKGNVYPKLLLNDFLESGSNPLIRRQALLEVGGFDETLSNAHDWDMWLRLAARYHFVVVPSVQIHYRVATHSMSTNVLGMEASSLKVIEKAYAQAPASLQPLKQRTLAGRYKYMLRKSLESPFSRQKAFTALKFLWYAARNEPSLFRSKILLRVLLRIAVISVFPSHSAESFLAKLSQLTNTKGL